MDAWKRDSPFRGVLGGHLVAATGGWIRRCEKPLGRLDTLEYGAVSLRIAYSQARIMVDGLDTLIGAFGMFGPQGAALESKYDPYRKPAEFEGLGAMYDPGAWFVVAEWGASQFHSVLGESTAWYVSDGYRLAKFTPYVTYDARKANSNTSDPGLHASAMPPAWQEPPPASMQSSTLPSAQSRFRTRLRSAYAGIWSKMWTSNCSTTAPA